MSQQKRASTPWHKSSYSSGANNCVEVSEGSTTGIRDTQHRDLGSLTFPSNEWQAFLNATEG